MSIIEKNMKNKFYYLDSLPSFAEAVENMRK